uniref:Uncharacterized protein n=1 Tax=Triticum urartu TaxID=4572 RepID=A0A8R7NXD7_TRIUA
MCILFHRLAMRPSSFFSEIAFQTQSEFCLVFSTGTSCSTGTGTARVRSSGCALPITPPRLPAGSASTLACFPSNLCLNVGSLLVKLFFARAF